jgi:hypothetical protein
MYFCCELFERFETSLDLHGTLLFSVVLIRDTIGRSLSLNWRTNSSRTSHEKILPKLNVQTLNATIFILIFKASQVEHTAYKFGIAFRSVHQ